MQLQGMQLQGMQLQGMQLQGMQLQGMQLQGMQLQGMQLQGTSLSGTLDGAPVSGQDLIGAVLVGRGPNGEEILFTISDIEVDAGDPAGDILLYTLLYQEPVSGAWLNACPADATGAQKAIPVSGVWNASGAHAASSTYFTFGCTSGVIAKCVRWGYKPWQSVAGESLEPYHQACTRMARADYCGNGTSHTQEGTAIDVYDRLDIQTQAPNDGMFFEAAWLPEGAYCISKARWNLIQLSILLECPGKLTLPTLGDILNQDSCAMRLSTQSRSHVLMSNRSLLQLHLSL